MQESSLTKYLRDGAVLEAFESYTELRNSIRFGGKTPADTPEIIKRQQAVIAALTEAGYTFSSVDTEAQLAEVDELVAKHEAQTADV